MGMFYDYSRVNREEWKFTYTGQELLDAAKAKLVEIDAAEKAQRDLMAKLMLDQTVTTVSEKVTECRKQIENFGKQREMLGVLVHEFARKPDREFHLALGDVTFFGLHEHIYNELL